MKQIFSILILILALMCAFSQNADARKKSTRTKTRTTNTVSGVVNNINANQFSRLIADYNSAPFRFKGNKLTVVSFYSTTCGPCRIQEQILSSLASQYGNRVNFYAIDANQNIQVSAAYNIKSVPTTLFFSPSGKSGTATGVIWPQNLVDIINSF